MDGWWKGAKAKLEGLADKVAEAVPELSARLQQLAAGGAGGGELVEVAGRRVRVVRLLAEGGYSFVFLAREAPPDGEDVQPGAAPAREYALKRVLCGGPAAMAEARREASLTASLPRCAHLLPLLGAAEGTAAGGGPGAPRRAALHMLFPLWQANLFDEARRRAAAGEPLAPAEALDVFRQLCLGLEAMHGAGLCHLDVKPLNVLVRARPRGAGGGYDAALMDFGSARPLARRAAGRADAAALAEEAERCSSAPYRPPELWEWDPPAGFPAVADGGAADAWAAGCVLYAALTRECASPFEAAAGAAGGSLALAVHSGRVAWPPPPPGAADAVPAEAKAIVEACLEVDPAARLRVADARARAEGALRALGWPAQRAA